MIEITSQTFSDYIWIPFKKRKKCILLLSLHHHILKCIHPFFNESLFLAIIFILFNIFFETTIFNPPLPWPFALSFSSTVCCFLFWLCVPGQLFLRWEWADRFLPSYYFCDVFAGFSILRNIRYYCNFWWLSRFHKSQ